ncbi:hypothetical protein [Paenibacillus brevis]|nr:hypothetical protein [Paenibacillus brevis]
MESVKHGNIGGKMYAAHYTELPDGQYLAVIAATDPAEVDSGGSLTKTCSTKEEALASIEDAWADLEKSALH